MTDRVQVVAVLASGVLLLVVLDLVRRRRLLESYSLPWLGATLALLGASLRRDVLDRAAAWLGVYYPPAVLLLALILIVFVMALWFSVIVSRQERQVHRLIEDAAVLAGELRELRNAQRRAEERAGGRAEEGSGVAASVSGPNRPER